MGRRFQPAGLQLHVSVPRTRSPWPWPRGFRLESIGKRLSPGGQLGWSCTIQAAGPIRSTGTRSPAAATATPSAFHASDAANAWRNIARVSNPRERRREPDRGASPHPQARPRRSIHSPTRCRSTSPRSRGPIPRPFSANWTRRSSSRTSSAPARSPRATRIPADLRG